MLLFDHFDFLSSFYEAFIRPKNPKELLALAGLPAEGALLDAGGSTGRVTQILRGMAAPLVVVDSSCSIRS